MSAAASARVYHRWFGLVSALFMIFIAATGLALQVDLWVTGNPVPGSQEAPPPTRRVTPPPDAEVGRLAAQATRLARELRPGLRIEHVDLAFAPAGTRATVGANGPFGDHLTLDLATGTVVPERRMTPGWHNWLQNLHAGYTFGTAGRLVSVAMALALLTLGITGLVVWLDLYRRRAAAGRRGLFWRR